MKKTRTSIELKYLEKLNDIRRWRKVAMRSMHQHIQNFKDKKDPICILTKQQVEFIAEDWGVIKRGMFVKNKLKEILRSPLEGSQTFADALFIFEQSLITERKQLIRKLGHVFIDRKYDLIDEILNRIIEIHQILPELPTSFLEGSDSCYTPNERQLDTRIDCMAMPG